MTGAHPEIIKDTVEKFEKWVFSIAKGTEWSL